jgi:DivIVA domain-containing protein
MLNVNGPIEVFVTNHSSGWQSYLPAIATVVGGLCVVIAAVVSGLWLWRNSSRTLKAEKDKADEDRRQAAAALDFEKQKAADARSDAEAALYEATRGSDADRLRRDRTACFDRFVWAQSHENDIDPEVLGAVLVGLVGDADSLGDTTLKTAIQVYNTQFFEAIKRRYVQAKDQIEAADHTSVVQSESASVDRAPTSMPHPDLAVRPESESNSTRRSALTPEDVRNVTFSKPPIGKRGYDEDEVDAFLDLVEAALREPTERTLTPEQVRDVTFSKPPIGKRGYDEDEVDAFLDRVEEDVRRRATGTDT